MLESGAAWTAATTGTQRIVRKLWCGRQSRRRSGCTRAGGRDVYTWIAVVVVYGRCSAASHRAQEERQSAATSAATAGQGAEGNSF